MRTIRVTIAVRILLVNTIISKGAVNNDVRRGQMDCSNFAQRSTFGGVVLLVTGRALHWSGF